MKIVRVQYTTTAAFAPVNRENIKAIVAELKTLAHPGIRYSAYTMPDGKTFMHLDHFESEKAHEVLQALSSFQRFRDQLWNSGLEVEPTLDILASVASTDSEFTEQPIV